MTLGEMKKQVLFQYNNDTEAMDDFEFMPHIVDYLNDGYDQLYYAYTDEHAEKLVVDYDTPVLPSWAHRGVVDYATWLIYRNGNSAKQARGQQYLQSFYDIRARLRDEKDDHIRHFINIPD